MADHPAPVARSPQPGHGVTSAAASALLSAADHVCDLSRDAAPTEVASGLADHAEHLSASPLARDQLLSRALEAASLDVIAGVEPLFSWPLFFSRDLAPSPEGRRHVRDWVSVQAGSDLGGGDAIADVLRARVGGDPPGRPLLERLRFEAWLQLALWDDPRIPAKAETRRLMRAGGLVLRDQLDTMRDRTATIRLVVPAR